MRPPVQTAHEQTPADTAAVKRLHDRGRGTVVVYPTPGRGGEGIARDILQALGKRFREHTPRDPRKLAVLAALWLHAEQVRDLVIAAADRRPASEWMLLRDICGNHGHGPRLTLVVEQPVSDHRLAAVAGDAVHEMTLADLVCADARRRRGGEDRR